MLAKIYSAAVYGVDAYEVEIEVNGGRGDIKIIIVGLPDAAVKESRDRVTTAIQNSGYYWPRGRTTINLAPADIKKEGPSFDLPIAVGMIAASEQLETDQLENFIMVGELALTGAVRPVKGVLSIALRARAEGKVGIFVPPENAADCLAELHRLGYRAAEIGVVAPASGDKPRVRLEPGCVTPVETPLPAAANS